MSPKRISPSDFITVIEISKGSKKKYELGRETSLITLGRILYTSTHYPASYGFIPRTYGGGCDSLDVLVLCFESLEPHTLVRYFPTGVISVFDGDHNDEETIATPFDDPIYNRYQDTSELPTHIFDEMSHFFRVYEELKSKGTAVKEVNGCEEATWIIETTLGNYVENFCR